MGCQQTCQRQINIIEEDYSESEFSETSQSKNDFEIHRLKNISFSKQKGKRDNSSLLEIIKQRENNKNKVSVLTLQKEPQKAENQEVSFINVCCTKPNQQSKLIENLSFSIASQLQQSERKNKNDTQMSIDRKREDNDQNNQQSLLKIVNQNSAINDSSKGAIMSLEKSHIKSRKDQQAIKSTLGNKINNKTSFDVLMNQDFSILPNKKRQNIPRKITSPIFFTQLQQFNVFQNIIDADEDLKRRGSNLQPMKVANLIQQNQQNSKEILNSISSSSFSSNFQDEQLENRRISTNLKAHPKSKFASLKKNCIMDDNKSDQDKEPQQNESEIDDDEEEEEEDHMKILYKSNTIQIEQKPEDKLLMLDETIQDLLMNKIKNKVDQISNLQLPKDISAERQQDNQNGTDKQNSGHSPKSNVEDSNMSQKSKNKKIASIEQSEIDYLGGSFQQMVKKKSKKNNSKLFDNQVLMMEKQNSKSRRRKTIKDKSGKKKVIQTTKTTSVLFHGALNNNGNSSNTININTQYNRQEDKSEEIKHDDQTPSPLNGERSKNQKRSPRKADRKKKDQKRGKTQLNMPKNIPNLNRNAQSNVVKDDDPQFLEFQNKWRQKQMEMTYNRKEFSSVILSKNHSHTDLSKNIAGMHGNMANRTLMNVRLAGMNSQANLGIVRRSSSKSNRRMSLSKQLFINEGRGKIEQKYDFLETIGQGGFGLVRKVRHKITGEIRAMKVIQIDQYDSSTLKNISNEVEILKQLDHPNIVKIYEFYQDKKNLYLIQEYICGGDLFDKIKNSKGGFEENTAALIMKQVLSAVFYCHKNGIVHRDLKPENILLEDANSYNSIKVIDFGTSRNFQNSKKMNQKFGTAYYIAPEVLKKNYDEKCDIWSCGVMLHIMLCGYPPFRGKHEREILEKVEIGYFSLSGPEWKTVSREAKLLLKQMLTYIPKERISAEQALSSSWIQIQTKTEVVTMQEAQNALQALRNFHIDIKLQQAACLYIASQLLTRQELMKFKDIFNCFDLNGDGILSSEELKELICVHLQISRDKAGREANKILSHIDINQNGAVDFTEFVIAIVSNKDILTDDKLLNAFNMLDMDGNGRITKEDLQQVFKGTSDQDILIDEMIEEADEKGNGEIAFQEFKKLMLSMQKYNQYETGHIYYQNESSISNQNLNLSMLNK